MVPAVLESLATVEVDGLDDVSVEVDRVAAWPLSGPVAAWPLSGPVAAVSRRSDHKRDTALGDQLVCAEP